MVDVQMDYDMVEEMARIFDQSAEEMEDIARVMQQIAEMMEQGAMVGEGGTRFVEGLNGPMANSLSKFSNKFVELSRDVYGALISLRDGDTEAGSRFSG